MPKFYDLSPSLSEKTVTWPTDPPTVFSDYKSVSQGGSSNVTSLAMSSHAGSHVDAPHHFLDGMETVDLIPLDILIGPALVVEIDSDSIDKKVLLEHLEGEKVERLLLKTENSALWAEKDFEPDFIGLKSDAAAYLVEKNVKLVGIDYLSIEAAHGVGDSVHRILLEKKIVIIESLNMSEVPPGKYELFCLPLKLEGLDGAPARVVLRSERN